jgi:predicted N-acetyltransferase YhbS
MQEIRGTERSTSKGSPVDGIRNLRLEEFDSFMQFLDRAFGFSPGMFQADSPHIYRPRPELCASAFVIERDGQIVSHVGLYPLEVVVHGVTWPIGGIGGVGTLPEERGKGHMTALLERAIDVMRESDIPLSWLAGDRQRYNAFGWERAGQVYELTFSRRSLDRAVVEPIEIEARRPVDALDVVKRLYSTPAYHTLRPHLPLQLRKEGLRAWTAQDGYALVRGGAWGPLSILELISASGRELGVIRALLDWTDRDDIRWNVPAWDERLARLMLGVSRWRAGDWDMWRINDLAQVLALARPILSRRAAALRDFDLAIGVRERDRTTVSTIAVRDGEVEIARGRHVGPYVEWSAVEAARAVLGGPPPAAEADLLPGLRALLPIPMVLPALDHV